MTIIDQIIPVSRSATEGETWSVCGDVYAFKATGPETGGAFFLMEARISPGGGTPPHIHRREAEAFHILEGEIEFWIDGKTTTIRTGGFVYAPLGIPHRFHNATKAPARMIVVAAPAGIEDFFRSIGTRVLGPSSPAVPFTEEALQRILDAAPRFGIEILPPPA